MTDLGSIPRSGRLLDSEVYTRLLDQYLDVGHRLYKGTEALCVDRGLRLADTFRAYVALMRVPYAPYYDTSFILKYFKTGRRSQVPREQVELEGAGLNHAAEAFRRNNVGRAPRVYALRPALDLIAMEFIRGKGYRDSSPGWWPKERMIKFVRQMAVFRLAILTQVENQLGVPRNAPYEGRVGPYCSEVWWDQDKSRLWDQMDRGPFPNRHELILASLRRDLLVSRWRSQHGRRIPYGSHFPTWADMISYLEKTIENIEREPRPTRPEFFSLNHNDLRLGFNIMLRGGKIAAIIDWETGSYDPLSMCVVDLATETDYDPREWREHAGPNGENFHVLPYRLEAEPTENRISSATDMGAERKPFPDWELIENNGGPLCEADFCGDDYPEDLASDEDESIVDAVEIHCDSDVDAEEECLAPGGGDDELARPNPHYVGGEWYYEPVYALMKEFIHRHRGAGLGPNGEWGKLPEEYSRPLADWDDPLFRRVTQTPFDGGHDQVVDEDRIDVAIAVTEAAAAKAHKVKKEKIAVPSRPRRMPTLLDAWGDTAATGGEEGSPRSPVSSAGYANWTRKLTPRRKRPITSPIGRKVGPSHDPIPLTAFPGAHAPTKAGRQGAEAGVPSTSDDERVRTVRDAVLARVMERLRSGLD
ncbi:unnamed protein product [Tuber aestivum]|uniref:Aminoglycoside phosphotransferase domain-containing protein n=1 Tax=Tuber aestivum TaxID=59557 RepID=A0A292PMY1_9PEZI|nr:unnamed protein product [Tuber aestivum]